MIAALLLIIVFVFLSMGFFLAAGTVAAKNKWNLKFALAASQFISWLVLLLIMRLGFVFALIVAVIAGAGVYNFPPTLTNTFKSLFHIWAHVENEDKLK